MVKVTVIGILSREYPRKDGTQGQGIRIYYTCPIAEGGEGLAAGEVFFTAKQFAELPFVPGIGEECHGFDAVIPGRGRQVVGFMPLK